MTQPDLDSEEVHADAQSIVSIIDSVRIVLELPHTYDNMRQRCYMGPQYYVVLRNDSVGYVQVMAGAREYKKLIDRNTTGNIVELFDAIFIKHTASVVAYDEHGGNMETSIDKPHLYFNIFYDNGKLFFKYIYIYEHPEECGIEYSEEFKNLYSGIKKEVVGLQESINSCSNASRASQYEYSPSILRWLMAR